MAKKKINSKLCIKCNRILPLEKFSANKLWASQQYRFTVADRKRHV